LVRRLEVELADVPSEVSGEAATARADAAARHGEADAILVGATTDAQFAAAHTAAAEGLKAVRTARTALGGTSWSGS
jgi:ribulose 1,5-bisphosphate synthetase/thiazole synthase